MKWSDCGSLFRMYRDACRPDPDMLVLDVVPVFPASSPSRPGRMVSIHDYHREIAWTIDYRGDNDDVPTLLYVGAGYTLIKQVFLRMFARPSGIVGGIRIYQDRYPYQRQGRAWVRIAVEIHRLDTTALSLLTLGELMSSVIKKECWCNIKYLKLNKLLNV